MAVNKVEINGEVKLDLTADTVTPETLLAGATAHNAAGEKIKGAADLSAKQDKITAQGVLQGDGAGGVTAAQTETWTFTMEDGSSVTKTVVLGGSS